MDRSTSGICRRDTDAVDAQFLRPGLGQNDPQLAGRNVFGCVVGRQHRDPRPSSAARNRTDTSLALIFPSTGTSTGSPSRSKRQRLLPK